MEDTAGIMFMPWDSETDTTRSGVQPGTIGNPQPPFSNGELLPQDEALPCKARVLE